MGIETGCCNICPECEGALMESVSDTRDECPRCGHIEEEEPMVYTAEDIMKAVGSTAKVRGISHECQLINVVAHDRMRILEELGIK